MTAQIQLACAEGKVNEEEPKVKTRVTRKRGNKNEFPVCANIWLTCDYKCKNFCSIYFLSLCTFFMFASQMAQLGFFSYHLMPRPGIEPASTELNLLEEPLPRKKLSKSFSEQEKFASISTSSFFVIIASFGRKKKKNFCGRIFPELSQLRSNFNDQLRNCFSNLFRAFNFPFRPFSWKLQCLDLWPKFHLIS